MKSVRLLASHKWVRFSITAISLKDAGQSLKLLAVGSSRKQEAAGSSSRKLARHPIADVD